MHHIPGVNREVKNYSVQMIAILRLVQNDFFRAQPPVLSHLHLPDRLSKKGSLQVSYLLFLSTHPLLFRSFTLEERKSTVERMNIYPGEEVPGLIPAVAARSLLVGSVSVQCDRLRQKSWSPCSVSCVAAC